MVYISVQRKQNKTDLSYILWGFRVSGLVLSYWRYGSWPLLCMERTELNWSIYFLWWVRVSGLVLNYWRWLVSTLYREERTKLFYILWWFRVSGLVLNYWRWLASTLCGGVAALVSQSTAMPHSPGTRGQVSAIADILKIWRTVILPLYYLGWSKATIQRRHR